MSTGLVYDPVFLRHDTGPGHPECSERLRHGYSYLSQQAWFADLKPLATAVADRKWLQTIHDDAYIDRSKASCDSGQTILDSMDVSISRESYSVALLACGSLLQLADCIIKKELDNGFAMIRPPGHHAEHDQALGFCLFNNVAILARYLQQHHGLDKILILDWDVHHGNGTQHSFEEDPSVLYISTHQYPYYPGTGSVCETGIGRGAGSILNCPMTAGYGDAEYTQAFNEYILPRIDAFRPEFIILSAGFDAHRSDPLGQINLTTEFYGWMTQRIMEKADMYAEGRIISALEGGYHLQMLAECMSEHLQVLAGQKIYQEYV